MKKYIFFISSILFILFLFIFFIFQYSEIKKIFSSSAENFIVIGKNIPNENENEKEKGKEKIITKTDENSNQILIFNGDSEEHQNENVNKNVNKNINNNNKYLIAKILDAEFYEKAFQFAKKTWKRTPDENAHIIVVNHHLLAPHFIADTFLSVKKNGIKNIIIFSPNHFSKGNKNILTTTTQWKTPFSFLQPITKNINISSDDITLANEHGISGIVGFIAYQFPQSKILPIIQKDNTTPEESIELAQTIIENFDKKNTLIILSLDFSHDLYPEISQFHDITSLEVFKNRDLNSLHRLEVDSIPSIRTVFEIAQQWKLSHFETTHLSSSSQLLKQPKQQDNTSYITGYFTEEKEVKRENCAEIETDESCRQAMQTEKKATALFLGDMMLDRYIRQTLDRNNWEYILNWRMKRFMNGSDITLVNFEGSMTENSPYPAHDMMLSFTSDPKWAKKMKEFGINIAGLANNHSLNFGKQGLKDTRKFLSEAHIDNFGQPFNTENISFIKNIRGLKIGFIGYHELFDGNIFPIVEEIKNLKKTTDFIVIYAHWGDEYKQNIHSRPQKKARTFIDEGADIVIGHHPHVVQPMEIYEGKYIFYSLGNFVFDQKVAKSVKTRLGLGIVFECSKNCSTDENKKISYELFPMVSNDEYQVRLMDAEERNIFIEWFQKISR